MTLKNIEFLRNKKNLLAFSGGTDSSALFNALVSENIDFDIIIVNYNTRTTSCEETMFAQDLTTAHNKMCFTKSVLIEKKSNFEKEARDVRYSFFEETIKEYRYDNLITGHNLNDKMEWFLMQMTRGAGIRELFGMEPISAKEIDNTTAKRLECNEKGIYYNIVRPLISTPKEEIMSYLKLNKLKHFFDKSNEDQKYTRNKFRANYVSKLVSEYSTGISKTFDILEKEVDFLDVKLEYIEKTEDYSIVKAEDYNFIAIGSLLLKKYGYVMSGPQRESLHTLCELVVTIGKMPCIISYRSNLITFTPYVTGVVMTNEFKEKMRKALVHPKHRGYLFMIENNKNYRRTQSA